MSAGRTLASIKSKRRQLLCMTGLLPVFAGIYYLAYWLRFDGGLPPEQVQLFGATLGLILLIKCVVFGWFRVFQGWGRHATFHDLLMLAQAAAGSSLVMTLGDYLFLPELSIPRSVFLMDWGATMLIVGGLRCLLRFFREGRRIFLLSPNRIPVLIVGANDSGEALLRAMRLNSLLPYEVVGFLTESPDRLHTYIGGVPVIGLVEETCQLAQEFSAREVLIAASHLPGRQVRELIDQCRTASVEVKVLPDYEELLSGSLAIQPRPVSIEDLLRREPVRLEMEGIRRWMDDKVVMVTGSAGSIGSEICRQLLRFNPRQLLLVDRWENGQFFMGRELEELQPHTSCEICIADLNDEARLRSLFERYRPDIIFHAAAYKHVPLMEANPGEAVKNTTLSTFRLANLADEYGVQSFVMISTDKAVNPTNVMGACKRVAEMYVQALAGESECRFVTVRFGNVLDSAGSVVPIFRDQIARGGPVTVTDPRMERFFMTIPEAAQLVVQAGAMGQGGEIFVLDMGEPVRIVDLAADVIRLSGLQVGEDIEIRFIGLRAGEKLYEELHAKGENHLPTRHSKIMVAQRRPHELESVREAISRLHSTVEDPQQVVRELLRAVPEYQPQTHTPEDRGRLAA